MACSAPSDAALAIGVRFVGGDVGLPEPSGEPRKWLNRLSIWMNWPGTSLGHPDAAAAGNVGPDACPTGHRVQRARPAPQLRCGSAT